MQAKKVLHIVSVSFSLKYFIGNQFIYFSEKGYDFTVSCSPCEDLFEYAEKMNFKTFPVNISRSINPLQDILSIYKLYRFIKKEKFDVVISHSPKGGLIGMLASYFAKTPKRIFFRHGLVFETLTGVKKQLMILVEKLIGFCSHKVVNVSSSIENLAVELKLNDVSKNIILGKGTCNGVNNNLFYPRSRTEFKDKTVVGFVGRMTKDKGITELINSLDYLNDYEDFLLLLIGPFDERDVLDDNIITKIKTHPKIKYLGEVKNTAHYYNQMDIFILPSYREGFPTVNLEAAASSLPIITTRSTGCIDSIIENETGIFTEIDSESIAKAIIFYIDNNEERINYGLSGLKFVTENFSESIIYKEIEDKLLQ
ncbi:glycosyltransferase family 4 protein [Chryseobacterium sp.]|uniref:glycosyltransferase family 4 protein n=1 Tax=Chryseobacterium sp. TaxID=1871047 RepID=UPI0012D1521E|nr:glycosyltransferase family 4 protein [Chryseobacterium sp.]MPS65206.1 glycosyltransferase family 1 protein [Chryseobacterium sp.]